MHSKLKHLIQKNCVYKVRVLWCFSAKFCSSLRFPPISSYLKLRDQGHIKTMDKIWCFSDRASWYRRVSSNPT